MEVYVRRGEERFGPFSPDQIKESLANGALIEGDLAWHKALKDWVPADEVLDTLRPAAAPVEETSAPASGGRKKTLLAVAAGVIGLGVAAAIFFSGGENKPKPAPAAGSMASDTPDPGPEPNTPQASLGANENPAPEGQPSGPTEVVVNPLATLPALPTGPATPVVVDDPSPFGEVTRHLDKGGTFYSFLSTQQAQGWVQTAFADGEVWMREFGLVPGQVPADTKSVKEGLDWAREFYAGLGLTGIDAIGASTREISGGLKRNVAVIHRDSAAGDGLIWKAFGNAPHELAGLKLMPAETALALHGDLDLATIVAWLQTMVEAHGSKEFRVDFGKDLKDAAFQKMLESYGGEVGFFVTLDPVKTIEVPAAAGVFGLFETKPPAAGTVEKGAAFPSPPAAADSKDNSPPTVKLPEPGFVFTLKVRDDGLQKIIQGLVSGQRLPLQMMQSGGVTIHHLPKPMPLDWPFTVQPAMFQVGDYFVIASSPTLAAKVVAVQQGKAPALADSADFKKLAGDISLQGNQFHYLSETLAQLHSAMARRQLEAGPASGPLKKLMIKVMANGMAAQVSVLQVRPEGIVLKTHTRGIGYDSAALLAGAGVPVLLGAAWALPALLEGGADSLAADQKFNDEMKLSQGRLLAAGLMQASQTNGQWPKAETWSDELLKIVRDPKHFVEPLMVNPLKPDEKICTWLFNRHLGGVKPADLPDPRNTVLLFAAESLEWNGAGDDRDFPVDVGEVITVFADGHLEVVGPKDLARLKWKP